MICLSSWPITNYRYLITNCSTAYNAHWSMYMSGEISLIYTELLFIKSNTTQVSKKRLRKECFPSNRSWNNKTRSYGNPLVRCSMERFSNDCRKTKTKAITPTNHNRGRQRDEPILSQFVAISCNSLKEREKSRVHGAIGFGFNSNWLKNWSESFTGLLAGCAGVELHNSVKPSQ